MKTTVDYETISRICDLDRRDYGRNTCYDYVDSLIEDENGFGVVIFVEPCGNITKYGDSWPDVLDWWIRVFSSQPDDWDYMKAGWYLDAIANNLPDNPEDVW